MKKQRFCGIRIQIQQILSERLRHDANSFRLGLWFAIHRFNKVNGTCIVTDEILAKEFEQSTDTITSTVRKLMDSGLFRIKRGRTGKATEYALDDDVWSQAISQKQRATVQGLRVNNAGKPAGHDPASLRDQTQQESGSFLKKEEKEENQYSLDCIDWQAVGGVGFYEMGTHRENQFKKTLAELGYSIDLLQLPFENGPNGKRYLMPKNGLPLSGSASRIPYERLLKATLIELRLLDLPET